MKLAVVNQQVPGETRVAMTPPVAKRLVGDGHEVWVGSGAGRDAHHDDAEYTDAGAAIKDAGSADLWQADVVLTIHMPAEQQIRQMRSGGVLIGMLAPLEQGSQVGVLADQGVTSFSMEFVPRVSRAQTMDVLSSQANIGGYKAVLLAADSGAKLYPMMMTAAGTIAPSRVLVIGAGVAGLQAIATAKRLGAIVEAYDVRPVVKEQVQSLGARFVELPLGTGDAQTAGGYAKEQTDQQRQKQAELMAKHVVAADAVITTAAIFGKAPPMLIPNNVVAQMHRGSVIVDMAADAKAGRGNCQATKPDQRITTDNRVIIIGVTNLPALVPVHASQAYASNMHSFVKEIAQEGSLKLDLEDEIQKGSVITHGGQVVNKMVAKAMQD